MVAGSILLVVLVGIAAFLRAVANPDVPPYAPIDEYVDGNQGWDQTDRRVYYRSPQGTRVVGLVGHGQLPAPMEHDWLVHLERPLSRQRFADPAHIGRYGFLDDPSDKSPLRLPVGFTRHWDEERQAYLLDFACATCHTGQLEVVRDGRRRALRVDGGQALHAVAASSFQPRAKSFAQEMGLAMLFTYLNPAKWRRFAQNVLGEDADAAARKRLAERFWATTKQLIAKPKSDCGSRFFGLLPAIGSCEFYPTEEGPGRIDALGRIANTVYADGLEPVDPELAGWNRKVANAPVSIPHIWDIWKFDWVQWNASARQPMARNVGEALGVGAAIRFPDGDGKVESSVEMEDLFCVENLLHTLRPPLWPEDAFGPIDVDEAVAGKALFEKRCRGCHGPHPRKPEDLPDGKPVEWVVVPVGFERIGTDENAARNFIDHCYDVSPVSPGEGCTEPDLCKQDSPLTGKPKSRDEQWKEGCVRSGAGLEKLTGLVETQAYADLRLTEDQQRSFNGFGLGIAVRPVEVLERYKARPLAGIWATPPFLHNGSVPNLYLMLSPAYERPDEFWIGTRDYDTKYLGYVSWETEGSFRFDTRVEGNSNGGHDFRAGNDKRWRPLTHRQRMQILEYLKVNGNEEHFLGEPGPEDAVAYEPDALFLERCPPRWKRRAECEETFNGECGDAW